MVNWYDEIYFKWPLTTWLKWSLIWVKMANKDYQKGLNLVVDSRWLLIHSDSKGRLNCISVKIQQIEQTFFLIWMN
jgi:hypothetical protein